MPPLTHLSILAGLKDPKARLRAWERFQGEYERVIKHWCRGFGVDPHTAEDLTQEILWKLYKKLPEHEHDPDRGRFHTWLRTVVHNAVISAIRKQGRQVQARGLGGSDAVARLAALVQPEATTRLAEAMERVSDPMLRAVIERVRTLVSEKRWQAFWRVRVEEQPVAEAAKELSLTKPAIYQACYFVGNKIEEEYSRGNVDRSDE